MKGIKLFIRKCKRVWNTLKKPTKEEFLLITKVSAIGILVLGFFGFFVSFLMELLQK